MIELSDVVEIAKLQATIFHLEAENERMQAALEKIYNSGMGVNFMESIRIAKAALDNLRGKGDE